MLPGFMSHVVAGSPEFPSYLAGNNVTSSPMPTLDVCVPAASLLVPRPSSVAHCSLFWLLPGTLKFI